MFELFARWQPISSILVCLTIVMALGTICRAQTPTYFPMIRAEDEDEYELSPDVLDGQDEGNGESGPDHIRDNAFLVEEASNQEPGVVQHVFNWVTLWDRAQGSRTRDFAAVYTMELPLGSQRHQFSSVTQLQSAFEDPAGDPATQQGGIGDTFLNYRYQLLANDDFLWCAPRFTLIVPTGDDRFGLGNGEVGYQFNLPISRYGETFDFHFNAGTTYTPDVSLPLPVGPNSPAHDLHAYNLGASAFWKPQTYLHFFVEGVFLQIDEIDELGRRDRLNQALVNPGVRYAICQFDEVEWVIGASVPIGLTPDSPDIGAFLYMSVEHIFRRTD
jgi:hypothetical protein